MGFKYEEDRIFIVASKCEGFITAHGTKWGADVEIEARLEDYDISVELNICDLFRVTCYGGKFHVRNRYVSMTLTEKQMNTYFVKPFVGLAKD